jgi:tetratricopeptide (TPR) repeat protein
MRRDDLDSARELRERLKRAGGREWIELASLRACFGEKRLSRSRRREVSDALAATMIDVHPPLLALSPPRRVRLEVLPETGAAAPPRSRWRQVWSRVHGKLLSPLGAGIGFAASVATLGGVFLAISNSAGSRLGRMTGDLNVAIAAFASDGTPSAQGVALADAEAHALSSELPRIDDTLDVQIRGPAQVDSIEGSDGLAKALAAERIAHAIGADILIYGQLITDAEGTRLQPAFYLNAEKLPWATGLGGQYSYGGPISSPYMLSVSIGGRAHIRTELVRRTSGYAEVFVGVGYYLLHNLGRAQQHLVRALNVAPTAAGKALLRLLLGNIATQERHLATAARDYLLARRSPTTEIRAELGLGDVYYAKTHRHCEAGRVSAAGLLTARRYFSKALRSAGGSVATDDASPLALKAAFGLGQVDLCFSEAGSTARWPAVREEFRAVVAGYRSGVPELRDDAAEAHAGLGLRDLSVERPPVAYVDARQEYGAAERLTTASEQRAYFYGAIGYADVKLGEYASAVRMYRRGAELAGVTTLRRTLAREANRVEKSTRSRT